MNTISCISETICVEVFKTNVNDVVLALQLVEKINASFDLLSVNFDLEDCDRILRVEGSDIEVEAIIGLLADEGFECVAL